MTHTRTETYEERAWRLATEATDPNALEKYRAASSAELSELLAEMPEASKRRVVAALRLLVLHPALSGTMP